MFRVLFSNEIPKTLVDLCRVGFVGIELDGTDQGNGKTIQ